MAWALGCMAATNRPIPDKHRTIINAALAFACRRACGIDDLAEIIKWADEVAVDLKKVDY